MYYLYILQSESSGQFYIGVTDDYLRRFHEHNFGNHNTFTSKFRPWIIAAVFQCGDSLGEAMKIEKFIKKQKSKKLIENIISGVPLTGILAPLVRVPHLRD
jgi:putative endonuclease